MISVSLNISFGGYLPHQFSFEIDPDNDNNEDNTKDRNPKVIQSTNWRLRVHQVFELGRDLS